MSVAEGTIETDYLVVGAGAMGMSFVDTLLDHSDADVVVVERRHRPGGHWLDSYPFVHLHQPSRSYGVSSTALGLDRVETEGPEAGMMERASGSEICGYFDEVMRHRMLASGRVRFYPMCEYLGDRRFRSRVNGRVTDVTVRRKVVDATRLASEVPATSPPPFEVADGVRCIPVGELTSVDEAPAGYVIVGGGKTSLDAICWLLDHGTDPDRITWIRPRDSWVLNRAYFQPGAGVVPTFEGVVLQLEAMLEYDSVDEIYERLGELGVMMRTDPSVRPTMMKGGTISVAELAQLQRIDDVVRLGHVLRIEPTEIVLEDGSVPTTPEHVHVHCASFGLPDRPAMSIFADDTITLQVVTRGSLPLSAGLIAVAEASGRTTEEKNQLCRPNPWPQTPFDWLRHLLLGMKTEIEWQDADDVQTWIDQSRLNLTKGLDEAADKAKVSELQGRFVAALFPALEKLDVLAVQASPDERSRMIGVR